MLLLEKVCLSLVSLRFLWMQRNTEPKRYGWPHIHNVQHTRFPLWSMHVLTAVMCTCKLSFLSEVWVCSPPQCTHVRFPLWSMSVLTRAHSVLPGIGQLFCLFTLTKTCHLWWTCAVILSSESHEVSWKQGRNCVIFEHVHESVVFFFLTHNILWRLTMEPIPLWE